MKPSASFFWEKLDSPGHDSCRLLRLPSGWRLAGAAVFWEAGRPCHFQYEVDADAGWLTRRARVAGWLGNRPVQSKLTRAAGGGWRADGVLQTAIEGCIDADLAFTPATNLIVLRRLALKVGQSADAAAAWLNFPAMRWVKLPQTYRRISRDEYEYQAPTVGYAGTLVVSRAGAIVHYPQLFRAWPDGARSPEIGRP